MALSQEQLKELVTAPEDTYLERKPETANRDELRRTLVAFANTIKGIREAVLLIGVADNGSVLGVKNPDDKQKEVRRICDEMCYPPINCHLEIINVQGQNVVAVSVPESSSRPHFAGPAFVRRGSESVIATRQQYEDLIASRHDKCRVLQGWKDQVVTLIEDKYRLDKGRVAGEWRAIRECTILESNAHIVRLNDIASTASYTVPLRQIEISYDEQRKRNQLIVTP
jgi:predicted HTH transcriptional regulator